MNILLQALVPTIVLGCIYAVVAVGFVLLFKAVGILSFAQGAFMVLGALIFYSLTTSAHFSILPALVASIVSVAIFGGLCFRVVYGRLVGANPLIVSFSTVGLGILLEAIIYLVWGTQAQNYPTLLHMRNVHVSSQIVISPDQWFTVAAALALVVGAAVLLHHSSVGIQMRAIADQQSLALYYGINVSRIATLAWGLAAMCAATGGIIFSLTSSLDPVALPSVGLATFPAIILGGIDSISGALVGGLLVSLIGTMLATALGGQYQDLVGYSILLLIVIVRPRGLFGSPSVTRL